MHQEFHPPHYTWTASNAKEAENILSAALDLLDAHLKTLMPNGAMERQDAKRTAPVALTVSMDLTGFLEQINTKRAIDKLEATLGDDH
ncbi:hypothetical protein [Streptomyces sp. NRRL S-1868]|uniref:hypothetical protein n=1 Tax=Streptomyces sp. NRRL S-1868 TaxID=1463892 RepID=UPI0004C562A9|nr:hypothetical protein [Streptomyces sp. NRRL S-1868]